MKQNGICASRKTRTGKSGELMVVGKTEVIGSEAVGSTVLSGHLCEHMTEH